MTSALAPRPLGVPFIPRPERGPRQDFGGRHIERDRDLKEGGHGDGALIVDVSQHRAAIQFGPLHQFFDRHARVVTREPQFEGDGAVEGGSG